MKHLVKRVIWRLRENRRFNDFWLTHRAGLQFAFYFLFALPKFFGVTPRECLICGHQGRFRAVGDPPQWDCRCPKCGSLDRQRLMALYLLRNADTGRGRIIHFAPDPCLARILKPRAAEYITADLFQPGVDRALDLQGLALPNASVDLFICSHLLEHVPDDRKALSELNRCTARGGTLLVMVPIVETWKTYEDPDVASADDRMRELHFGQFDHVRMYGADLRDRIRDAGFSLEEFVASPDECLRYGLQRGETVFVGRVPK